MRLFRRALTGVRGRKRSSRAVPSSGIGMRRPPAARKDMVAAVVKQFHALTLDQRYRAVARTLQSNRQLNDDIEQFFREADKDKDGLLNRNEFRSFLTTRFSLKVPRADPDATATTRPTNRQLQLVMLTSAIPFVGFGFVDNIIMLVTGDMVEEHFHEALHMSMLFAAALGNTVANVVGLSLGGVVEPMVQRLGLPDPQLSKAQSRMAITHWCNFFASALGVTVGCLLGMFPLLFMSHEKYEQEIIEAEKRRVLALIAEEEDEEELQKTKEQEATASSVDVVASSSNSLVALA